MSTQYPYSHTLYMALRQLELALSQEGNLEFLRDHGDCSPLTFVQTVSKNIDAMENKKSVIE